MFDQEQRLTLKGTVRKFQWTNPHCYIQLLVKDEQGQQTEWSVETAAPIYLQQMGWKPASLKAGDEVTLIVAPLRKPGKNKSGLLIDAIRADGKSVSKRPGAPL